MELIEILDKMAKEKEIAKMNPADLPDAVRSAWISRINTAVNKLRELQSVYAKTFFNVATPIFLTGDEKVIGQIGKLLEEYGSGIGIDGNGLFKTLAADIFPVMGKNRAWIMDYTERLNREFGRINDGMGALGFRRIMPDKASFAVQNIEELVGMIRTWIVKSNGLNPNFQYLIRKIRDKATDLSINVEPYVVIGNLPPAEAKLFSASFRNYSISASISADEDPKVALSDLIKKSQKNKEKDVRNKKR